MGSLWLQTSGLGPPCNPVTAPRYSTAADHLERFDLTGGGDKLNRVISQLSTDRDRNGSSVDAAAPRRLRGTHS